MQCLEWEANSLRAAALTPYQSVVQFFDMADEPLPLQKMDIGEEGEMFAARWSPHYDGNMLGVAVGKTALCLDTRTPKEHLRVANAHSHRTISMDFNPNLQHV